MARNNKNYRKFLNNLENSGTAYVSFHVDCDKGGYIGAEFTIKDCNSEATLEFYIPRAKRKGKPRIENAQAKIAILREAIDEFDKAFSEALVERSKPKKRKKAKKK